MKRRREEVASFEELVPYIAFGEGREPRVSRQVGKPKLWTLRSRLT